MHYYYVRSFNMGDSKLQILSRQRICMECKICRVCEQEMQYKFG